MINEAEGPHHLYGFSEEEIPQSHVQDYYESKFRRLIKLSDNFVSYVAESGWHGGRCCENSNDNVPTCALLYVTINEKLKELKTELLKIADKFVAREVEAIDYRADGYGKSHET